MKVKCSWIYILFDICISLKQRGYFSRFMSTKLSTNMLSDSGYNDNFNQQRHSSALNMNFTQFIDQFPEDALVKRRKYIEFLDKKEVRQEAVLRILQFNVLADGLSGSRDDLGDFSKNKANILAWEYRKNKLLYEIIQYHPDIITLQEVDHYHDFFWPELVALGYQGYFAPKPTSKSLVETQGAGQADGCAMFVRSDRLRVVSSETKTLALSKAELTSSGELNEDETNILAQNQVALIIVCELLDGQGEILTKPSSSSSSSASSSPYPASPPSASTAPPSAAATTTTTTSTGRLLAPPIVIATTHLKSIKSLIGERYRVRGIQDVLNSTQRIYRHYAEKMGRKPVVLLTGDLNAISTKTKDNMIIGTGNDYDPLCYNKIKNHELRLRSVYQDDLLVRQESPYSLSCAEFYTTWKARRRSNNNNNISKAIMMSRIGPGSDSTSSIGSSGDGKEEEVIIKRSIDYIFYGQYIEKTINDENDGYDGDNEERKKQLQRMMITRKRLQRNRRRHQLKQKEKRLKQQQQKMHQNLHSNDTNHANLESWKEDEEDDEVKEEIPVPIVVKEQVREKWQQRQQLAEDEDLDGNNTDDEYGYDPVSAVVSEEQLTMERAYRRVVIASSPWEIGASTLLRATVYFFLLVIPSTSILQENLSLNEKAFIFGLAILCSFIFEIISDGSIFRPIISPINTSLLIKQQEQLQRQKQQQESNKMSKKNGLAAAGGKDKGERDISRENKKELQTKKDNRVEEEEDDFSNYENKESFLLRSAENLFKNNPLTVAALKPLFQIENGFLSTVFTTVADIQQRTNLFPLKNYGQPGFRTVAVLDIFSEEEVGPELFPSKDYPSDHVAIAADLELLW